MPRGNGQHARLAHQHRAGDDAGFVHGKAGQRDVDLAVAEPGEDVAHLRLAQPYLAAGFALAEQLGCSGQELAAGGADERDAQRSCEAAARIDRPLERGGDLGPGGPYLLLQLPADRGQLHAAAGAVEQRDADAAFQLGDGLADPGRGDVQALCGTAEMQLLGQGEEGFQLVPLQHRPPHR
jgi:hypothetical protein